MESVIANYKAKLEAAKNGDIQISAEELKRLVNTVDNFNRHEGRIDYLGVKQRASDSGLAPTTEVYQFNINHNGKENA